MKATAKTLALLSGLLCWAGPGFAGLHLGVFSAAERPAGTEGLCDAFAGACHRRVSAEPAPDMQSVFDRLDAVNQSVNHEIHPVRDPEGIGSRWSLPDGRSGDCKHYALLKKKRLIEAGLPAEALLLAIVIGEASELHAVLVSRTSTGDFVLDNMNDRVLRWDETGYTFLKMQNEEDGEKWDAILEGPRARRF